MIFKRPDSPFWWMLLEGTGRRKESTRIRHDAATASLRQKNRAAAEAVYHARMTQLARSSAGLPIDSAQTFDAYANWYDTHHIAKHKSVDRERVILAHLRSFFGRYRLADIRPARWTEYETHRRDAGASINTIGRELALMKSLLRSAVGEHLEVSPLAHVKRKTERLPAKRTLTAADEKRLLAELHDPEIRDLFLLATGSLLRQQNCVFLKRSEVHGSKIVLMTKTGPHVVSLDGPTTLQRRVKHVLRRRRPPTLDGFYFPRWAALFQANRDSANSFMLKIVRRAVERAGLRWGLRNGGLTWHSLTRASGATRLIREHGIDVRTVQLLGGWASLDQMASYLGLDLTYTSRARDQGKSEISQDVFGQTQKPPQNRKSNTVNRK